MKPHMTSREETLFLSFVRNSDKYLEFGCGGSTVLASCYVKKWILSVESSKEWKDNVLKRTGTTNTYIMYVNIGKIGIWGTPIDETMKGFWPNYHTWIWQYEKRAKSADLYFIDGRFRVACFSQIYLHCKPDAIIGIHDFESRIKLYKDIEKIGRKIASCEDISFFLPIPDKENIAINLLEKYQYNWR
jgi:hypothetical protein